MDLDIIRAWKDENYLNALPEEQRTLFPHNPSGEFEITDEVLAYISGSKKDPTDWLDKTPSSFSWFCNASLDTTKPK